MTQPDETFLKEFDAALTRRILRYLKPYTRLAAIALVATLLFSVAAPLYGLIQRYAIDHALGPKVLTAGSDLATRQGLYRVLLTAAGLFLGLRILDFFMRYAATYVINYLGQKVLYDIRSDIFTKLQRLPLAFFDANPVGRLITRVTSDVDAINQFITAGLVSLITSSFLIIAYVVIMLSVSWPLAIISFLVLPILFYASGFFRTKIRYAFRNTRIQQAIVNTKLNENITGMLTVQLFGRENHNAQDFDGSNRKLLGATLNSVQVVLAVSADGRHSRSRCQRPGAVVCRAQHFAHGGRGQPGRLSGGFRRHAGDAGRLQRLCRPALSADSGSGRRDEQPPGGDGLRRAHLRCAGRTRDHSG